MMVVFDMAGTTVDENMVVYRPCLSHQCGGLQLDDKTGSKGRRGQGKITSDKSILGTFTRNHDAALADSIYQDFMALLEKAYDTLVVLQQPNAGELFRHYGSGRSSSS